MRAQFITASEVAEIMGISRSKAYQIVREMNRELKAQGYLTVAGKCPAQYFKQKIYGFQMEGSRLTIHLTRAYHMKPAKAIPRRKILRKCVRESDA